MDDGLSVLVDWSRRGYLPLRDVPLQPDDDPDPHLSDGVDPASGQPLEQCGVNVRLAP